MGKKYIVEIGRLERLYKASVNGNRKPDMTWLSPEVDLTPYTEPDLEQVRKEAYDDGYNAGYGRKIDASYQEGLSDAWEAARKICLNDSDGGLTVTEIAKIFDVSHYRDAMKKYSAHEAIEKIRQYEQEKEEEIQVGDEIETPSGLKGYVVNFTDDELVHYVSSEGRFGTMGMSAVSKTGRHFPEIAEVLQKMKES